MPSPVSWKKISIESATIVVSILLAFWIDAWWGSRQDRHDEQIVLQSLLAEFREIRENINDVNRYQVAIREAARKLAEWSAEPNPEVGDQEIERYISYQYWYSWPDNFSAPSLNYAISRGDLRLISNEQLRSKLLQWSTMFSWVEGDMQQDLDFFNNQLRPYLNRHISSSQLWQVESQRPGDSSYVLPPVSISAGPNVSHRKVIQDLEFRNLMLEREGMLSEVISLGRTPDLAKQLEETITMLEREVSGN